jgi:hypothetical protein
VPCEYLGLGRCQYSPSPCHWGPQAYYVLERHRWAALQVASRSCGGPSLSSSILWLHLLLKSAVTHPLKGICVAEPCWDGWLSYAVTRTLNFRDREFLATGISHGAPAPAHVLASSLRPAKSWRHHLNPHRSFHRASRPTTNNLCSRCDCVYTLHHPTTTFWSQPPQPADYCTYTRQIPILVH